jgi:NDP-sugar pyrophosphorylase family protein
MIVGAGGHAKDIDAWFGGDSTFVESPRGIPYAYIGINDGPTRRRLDCHEKDFDGVLVGPCTYHGPDVVLGRHTHVNANCFLTRCTIGAYCTLGPGVIICGDVTIGDDCTIGAGAVISNLVTLEDGVTIGAGAVVPPGRHLTAGTYVGVPVRRIVPGPYPGAPVVAILHEGETITNRSDT